MTLSLSLDYSNLLQVHFQLVLASDGEDTHAVALYQQDLDYRVDVRVFNFIYNHTAVGYRVGDTLYNDTCVSNDIRNVFRIENYPSCGNSFIFGLDDFYFVFRPPFYSLLYNLTDGCK